MNNASSRMRKRLVLILDGLAEPDSPSTLQRAKTPYLDRLAQKGSVGLLDVQPCDREGEPTQPTSERGILSLCGWPADETVPSRALLLTQTLDKPLSFDCPHWVWLLNPAKISGNRLERYVENAPGALFWEEFLRRAALDPAASEFTFVPLRGSDGMLPRVLAFSRDTGDDPGKCFPPSRGLQIPGQGLAAMLVSLSGRLVPPNSEFNCVWPWGMGKWHPETRSPNSDPNPAKWMIGAVPLAIGIGRSLGWHTQGVPGGTGDVNTSLENKREAIHCALQTPHVSHVFCHIEGFDMASHRRLPSQKREFLERFDRTISPGLLDWLANGLLDDVWITSDHLSSPRTGDHAVGPVPYLHVGPTEIGGKNHRFSEDDAYLGNRMSLADWNRALE